jgi:nitroreductase
MTKIAQTQYPVHPLIRNRWSNRAFLDKPIIDDDLMTLFEAASWAPSSMNEQPWRYRFAHRGTPEFQAMHDCLLEGNQPWTKQAAVMILSSAKLRFERNDKPNRHAFHDVGAANALLFMQATEMNIYGHMMGGYDPDKTKALFGLGEDEEAVCFIALGYLGSPDSLEEPFKTREITPRSRKILGDFVSGFQLDSGN